MIRPASPDRPRLTPAIRAQYLAYRAAHDPRPVDHGPFLTVADVAARIGAAIRDAAAFSMVRLGDGEGCCLFHGAPGYEDMAALILRRQLSNQFGPQDWTPAQMQSVADEMARAVAGASVLTAARRPEVHARLVATPPGAERDMRGFVGATFVQHLFASRGITASRAVYPDTYLHVALLPMLPALLRGCDLAVVSCRGAAFHTRLAGAMGARLVAEVHVPGAANSGGIDGAPLFPDQLPRVTAEVMAAARPGVVMLVAAGVCAKALCLDAAAQGAVALDIGSVMDVLAGRGVRAYQDEGFVQRWQV